VIKFTFNPKKTAQAGALLLRLNGGDMSKYIFIKMLYLADREAFARWGEPLTGDEAVSMEFGPVLSAVYDLAKGERPGLRAEWEPFISDAEEETNRVFLKADPGDDELSPAEIKILEGIHARFKGFTWKMMRDHCHDFEEFDETVGKTSRPIPAEKIMTAVGKKPEEIETTRRNLNELKVMEALFGRQQGTACFRNFRNFFARSSDCNPPSIIRRRSAAEARSGWTLQSDKLFCNPWTGHAFALR
jgi:hypothetical protein